MAPQSPQSQWPHHVWIITQETTGEDGFEGSEILEVHPALQSANCAARSRFISEVENYGSDDVEEEYDALGCYTGHAEMEDDSESSLEIKVLEKVVTGHHVVEGVQENGPQVIRPPTQHETSPYKHTSSITNDTSSSAAPAASPKSTYGHMVTVPIGKPAGLRGANFSITGTLATMCATSANSAINIYGGHIAVHLHDADYVVVGRDADRGTLRIAHQLEIQIITERMLHDLIRGGIPASKVLRHERFQNHRIMFDTSQTAKNPLLSEHLQLTLPGEDVPRTKRQRLESIP